MNTNSIFIGLVVLTLAASTTQAVPIAGSTAGIFQNPSPAGAVVTGVGTSHFTWGIGADGTPPSSLLFTGTTFASNTDSYFDIGSLSYHNGATVLGTEANSVDLALTVDFTNPAGVTQTLVYPLQLITTPNTGTPEQNADIVQFPSTLPPQTFILDGVPYTLGIQVGTVSEGGFSTQTTFSVLEGESATAVLQGIVTVPVSTVPEPGTLALVGLGAISMLRILRRHT